MKRVFFVWFLPMLLAVVLTHVATVHFGTFRMFDSRKTMAVDDDDLVIIAARPTRKIDTEEDLAYLRHRVFGEKNEDPWPHEKRGEFFGYSGVAWSKKPLPEVKLDFEKLLQLFAMQKTAKD